MTEQCQCNYCRLQVTETVFEKMSSEFTSKVIELFLKQTKGFQSTEMNLATLHTVATEYKVAMAGPKDDKDEEHIRIKLINAFATCYESPVYFYDAVCGLQHLLPSIQHALAVDPTITSAPILTKIITPEVFLHYYITRKFPEEITTLLNKLATAESMTEIQQ